MAVGKGSMARAVRAVETAPAEGKAETVANAVVIAKTDMAEEISEKQKASEGKREERSEEKPGKKRTSSGKKAAAVKEDIAEAEGSGKESAGENKEADSSAIIYQTSYQVLDRAASVNEVFQVGEAMPIYYY